jgi:hypothetical protein
VSTLDRIVELGHSFQAAKTLLSAVELGVFTALADGPLDAQALGGRIGIDPRGAVDFFDTLVALGLIERDRAGCYTNTAEASLYLDQTKQTYIGGLFELLNSRHFSAWTSLTDALRGNWPGANEDHGHYPALYTDPAALTAFASGMTGAARLVAPAIAAQFPWRDYQRIADIGTAEGGLLVALALAFPHLRGCGFDLPALKPLFEIYVRSHGLSDRLQFCAGNFFQDRLPAADVLVMGRILHNWDLPTKHMLLRKAYEALPAGGVLVVYERLVDEERRKAVAALTMSLHMLIMTAGGFAFTASDCQRWMRGAGFEDFRVTPLVAGYSMIVGTKAS